MNPLYSTRLHARNPLFFQEFIRIQKKFKIFPPICRLSDLKGRKAVKLIVDNAKPVEKEKKTAKKAAKKEDAAEAPAEEAKTEE